MNELDISKLKRLIDSLVGVSTKAEAKPIYKKLIFEASQLSGKIDPYALVKLTESINCANSASGQVNDKDHWKDLVEMSWYKFEDIVRCKSET